MKLAEKIAVITGAASGIGFATAQLFAAEGAYVVIADRNVDAAKEAAETLIAAGGQAEAVQVDVTVADQVKALLDGVAARHGRLDILVNNAGYGFAGTVATTSVEDWDALFAVNVRGVFLGCKYAIPIFEAQGGGIIVNTASGAAIAAIPDRAAYNASKGAVAALTRAVAVDHADAKVRVNCVAPGVIETPYFADFFAKVPDAAAFRKGLEDRHIMQRLGQPSEVAKAILFLSCDDSTFCTGSTLVVDGGWTIQ